MSTASVPPLLGGKFTIGAESRYFLGHFPGAPLFPGVAQLACLLELCASQVGFPLAWSEIAHVRFRRPLEPGEELVWSARTEAGTTSFEFRRGQEVLTSGKGCLAACARRLALEDSTTQCAPTPLPPPAKLLPQEGPALLLERLERLGQGSLVAIGQASEASGFVSTGNMPLVACLEMAAQTAAALEALERRAAGGATAPRRGLLVGVRDVRLDPIELCAPIPLRLEIRMEARSLPLSHYSFTACLGERELARGALATYLMDERVEGANSTPTRP